MESIILYITLLLAGFILFGMEIFIPGGVLGIFMASGIGVSAFSPRVMSGIIDARDAAFSGFSLSFAMLAGCVVVSTIIMLLFKNADSRQPAQTSQHNNTV